MPPLPRHRELIDCVSSAQLEINRWEPAIAAGRLLLPTPRNLDLNKKVTLTKEGETSPVHLDIYHHFETVTNRRNRVTQEYADRRTYSPHGAACGDSIQYYKWRAGGYSKFSRYSRTGERSQEQLQRLPDGSLFLMRRGGVVVAKQIAGAGEEGGTKWMVDSWDENGKSRAIETIDSEGRIVQSVGWQSTEFGARREEYTYEYDDDGKLTKETLFITPTDQNENDYNMERTETTEYIYDGNQVVIQTTLEDGTVVRELVRTYDDQGRLEAVEGTENLPGEGRMREICIAAWGYACKPEVLSAPLEYRA